jgi:hypothetical protein
MLKPRVEQGCRFDARLASSAVLVLVRREILQPLQRELP